MLFVGVDARIRPLQYGVTLTRSYPLPILKPDKEKDANKRPRVLRRSRRRTCRCLRCRAAR